MSLINSGKRIMQIMKNKIMKLMKNNGMELC